jgi:hypothetical protein
MERKKALAYQQGRNPLAGAKMTVPIFLFRIFTPLNFIQ